MFEMSFKNKMENHRLIRCVLSLNKNVGLHWADKCYGYVIYFTLQESVHKY